MAALASSHLAENSRAPNSDQFPESGPSFTAVNGTASPTPVKSKPTQETPRDAAMETNGRPRPGGQQEQPISPSHPELTKLESAAFAAPPASADVVGPQSATPNHQRQETGDEPKNRYVSSHSRTPSSQQSKAGMASPQKRKRSYSNEYDDPNNNPTYHSHALPASPERQSMYATENGRIQEQDHIGTPAYPPPPEHPALYPRPQRHQLVRGAYDQRIDPSIAPAPRPYYSDERMVEALQRENQSYDAMGARNNFASPEDDDDQHAQQYGDYGTNRSSQSGQDVDRKRRKRVFSNRTKTGCMTCRRRKKKCDEQHPECNNCLRGGFVCEGYTMRNTWQKPPNPKAPVPLQSKHGYPVPIHRAPSYQPRYSSEVSPEYPGPPLSGPHPSVPDGDRVKPILLDEERDMYAKSSPTNAHAKPAWTKAARPYPSNPPHISKYQPEADYRTGSVQEMPYEGPDHSSMHPPAPAHRTNSSQSQYSMPASQTPNHTNAQAVAQTALQQSTALRPSPHRRADSVTEREKMLKGNYYYPFSPALVEDRERCIAAIWRFNNATNPSHGASPEERARLFRAIVNIRPSPEPVPSGNSADGTNSIPPSMSMTMPQGSVGERVVVEAPFHCDYGYNITIGDDVLIGADCRISDTCSVSIGARCIFSPNVKLVCATYPIDPRRRMGSGGQALGRSIVIEEDCWIGSNVTILAGVRVGKSSTVGAGSLLHNDVPRFTVVAGNPAKVSRGIYDGQDGL